MDEKWKRIFTQKWKRMLAHNLDKTFEPQAAIR